MHAGELLLSFKDYILKRFTIIISDWNKVDPDIRNIDSYALFSKSYWMLKPFEYS